MNAPTFKTGRVASIDIFRALTMLCMIFVNDFWSLLNVPHWLEHARPGEDFLGFSDVVFPAFLFALGLSIPFAIENRIAKGESKLKTIVHILLRTLALLVMGLFTVNTEAGVSAATGLSQPVFVILMVTAFFLIWNVYPKAAGIKKHLFVTLQVAGALMLVYLAFIFRDGNGEGMQERWWGILGLIGWTYLPCALIYLIVRRRLYTQLLILLAFILLNMAGSNRWLGFFDGVMVSNGAHHVFTMSGIVVSLLFSRFGEAARMKIPAVILIVAGIALLLAGVAARPYCWIVSKIAATPTWVFFCTGISVLLYVLLYLTVELKGQGRLFGIIKPAGTATLTCYLVPYVVYNLFQLCSVSFPDAIRTCPAGLLKSLAFALAIIGITALLGKIHIKLKI